MFRINARNIRNCLIGVVTTVMIYVVGTLGLSCMVIGGKIGEGNAELVVNAVIIVAVAIGATLAGNSTTKKYIGNVIHTLLTLTVLLICAILLKGKWTDVSSRLMFVMLGFIISCVITSKVGRNRQSTKRRYR